MEDGSGLSLTAVAVDKDKNSKQAVKWAIDHLVQLSTIILIHVRNKSSSTEASTEAIRDKADAELNLLFLPYRGFCARKGMQMKEIVLEGDDISKAIVNHINANHIQNIVVGASNKSLLMKKLRNHDVPSCLIKLAPDFCAVYVISKGKPITVRSAKTPSSASVIPPRHFLSITPNIQPDYMKKTSRDRPFSMAHSAPTNQFMQHLDSLNTPRRAADYGDSISDDMYLAGSLLFESMDSGDSLEVSSASTDSPRSNLSPITGVSTFLALIWGEKTK